MKKLLLLLAGVFLLTACEKEPNVAPKIEEESQLSALDRYLMRVAEEGIGMLGDTPTRAGARRVIDPARTRAFVKATTRSEEDTLFYVVNFADSTGFALVDADTTSPTPLIAVTEQGNYSPGEVTNTGFDLYMDMLSQNSTRGIIPDVEIDSLPSPDLIIRTEVEDYYTNWVSKGPYVQVKWGQGDSLYTENRPYNLYCLDDEGNTCPAGCMAVALAQIFSSHRYPVTFPITFDGSNSICLMQWPTVLSHIGAPSGSGCTSTCWDHQYMQKLIREIGEQVDMEYTTEASGSNDNNVHKALTHFYYNYTGLKDYTYALAKNDLDLGLSLYMSGVRTGFRGHAWVLDGYKERSHIYRKIYHYYDGTSETIESRTTRYKYLHINWGWNGRNNGYFVAGVFNAANAYEYDSSTSNNQTYNYTMMLTLMTGIAPAAD